MLLLIRFTEYDLHSLAPNDIRQCKKLRHLIFFLIFYNILSDIVKKHAVRITL